MAGNGGCIRSRLCLELGTPPGRSFCSFLHFFSNFFPALFLFAYIRFFFNKRIKIKWFHLVCTVNSQVIYELKAGGVDERRLVGAKLEKLAEGESGMTISSLLSGLYLCLIEWLSYSGIISYCFSFPLE
jgi:hypothetical protein